MPGELLAWNLHSPESLSTTRLGQPKSGLASTPLSTPSAASRLCHLQDAGLVTGKDGNVLRPQRRGKQPASAVSNKTAAKGGTRCKNLAGVPAWKFMWHPLGGCWLANLVAAQSIAAVQVRHWHFPWLQKWGLASCTPSPWQSCGEKAASLSTHLVGWSGTLKVLPRQQDGGRPPRLHLRLLANECARLQMKADLLLLDVFEKFWRSSGPKKKSSPDNPPAEMDDSPVDAKG